MVETASPIKETLASFLWADCPASGLCEARQWRDKGSKGICGACLMGTSDAFILLVAMAYQTP